MNGHITKKGDRYYVVLELGKDPITGARKRKWHSGYARQKEAKAALAKLVTTVNDGTYVEPSKVTLAEYLPRWLESRRATIRPNTLAGYRSVVDTHLVPKIGHLQLRQVDRTTMNDLYASLSESGRVVPKTDGDGNVTVAGLSPRTVRLVHTVAHRAFGDAVEDGLIARNPADRATVPGKTRSATPSWNAGQVRAFLEHTATDRLAAAFVVLANTGLRRSELLGLRWADVNLEASTVAVRQVVGLDGYKPYLSEPKTAKSRRVVALDPATTACLRAHQKRQKEERLASEAWTDNDLVFPRPDGSLTHPQALSATFDKLVAAAGLPKIGIHGLRHSHISLGLEAGVPLQLMSERAGHFSVALTGDVYSHSLPSQHHAAAAALAALLAPAGTDGA